MSELEAHYRRLRRVGKGNIWKRAFLGLAVILIGGVVGAVLAGPGWTWEVKATLGLAVMASLAWYGIHETEAEDLKTICEDFKEDILDSIELEQVTAVAHLRSM